MRHSGKVKIDCRYMTAGPFTGEHRCALSIGGVQRGLIYVGLPATFQHMPDSPEALDEAARLALENALDDGKVDETDVEWGKRGVIVRTR